MLGCRFSSMATQKIAACTAPGALPSPNPVERESPKLAPEHISVSGTVQHARTMLLELQMLLYHTVLSAVAVPNGSYVSPGIPRR